mgnify:CR=1 FL=1
MASEGGGLGVSVCEGEREGGRRCREGGGDGDGDGDEDEDEDEAERGGGSSHGCELN